MVKIILGFFLILLSGLAQASRHILVLHSYDMSYTWTATMQEGIVEGLKGLPDDYEVHYEFMDSRRFNQSKHFLKLKRWFSEKYAGMNFDAVLTADDDAYNFFMEYYKDLFPKSDLFFSGKGTFDNSVFQTFPNRIFGMMEFIDMLGNLRLAGNLHNTKKAYHLVEASTTGHVQHEKWMRVFRSEAPEFEVVPLNMDNYTHSEILEKVKTLNDGVLLLNVIGIDKNGEVVDHLEMTRKIAEVSKIPIYVESSMRIGTGVVGGQVTDGKRHGHSIAAKLVRVIKEEDTSFPVVQSNENLYMFDYKTIRKFGIDETKLPEGSIIVGKPEAFYFQYRKYMLGMALALGMLIIVILVQTNRIRVKRKFQARLKEKVQQRTLELNIQIEEQKRLRKTLISKEKLASLGSLTAGIAHEIKNPLNIILNSAIAIESKANNLTGADPKTISDIKRMIDFIIKNSYRADSIIQNMLGQAKNTESQPLEVNLNKLLDEALALVYHASRTKFPINAELIKDYADLPPVLVKKENVLRAFINLIENSFYALNRKNLLTPHFNPQMSIRTYKHSEFFVAVEIKDNGIGISAEVLDKVQLPFFTTKPAGEGTGLGLSMVNDIVSAHSGELDILSEEGQYTLIKIILPIKADIQ